MQLCTKRSKLIAPSPLLSYVLKRISTNWGLNLYPKATSALVYSSIWIFPLLSVSNRSKSERHAARNPQRPQNSSKPIVPERFVSNMRIIILTVWGSNDDQSPFTRAARSSFSLSWPLSKDPVSLSSGLWRSYILTIFINCFEERPESWIRARWSGRGRWS
jgi:hypothetical protein